MLAAVPSAAPASLRAMWVVELICSDNECTEELELVVADLNEAERVGCTCGHAFILVSVSEAELV
jgi:hypothetical protein